MRMIDETDLQILELLQKDGRIRNAEIARRLDMAASAILERIRKLEARGLIRGYEARIDPGQVGCGLLAFIFVRSDELPGEESMGQRLTEVPEVLEVHHIAGEDCYLAKVRCRGTDELGELLKETFGRIEGVRSTRTVIALGTLKETGRVPLAPGEDDDD